MTDDDDKVVLLPSALEKLHAEGKAHKFTQWLYHDDAVQLNLQDPEDPVLLLTDPEKLEGIALSVDDAIQLGITLIQAAGVFIHIDGNADDD